MSFVLLGILNSQAPSVPRELEYLVIAGGGGGGSGFNDGGGAGGAGGYRSSVQGESSGGGASAESIFEFSLSTNYTVTVGAGGAGAPAVATNDDNPGDKGSDSTFATIIAEGGGFGQVGQGLKAGDGGSGGAPGRNTSLVASGAVNQGFDGGVAPQPGGVNENNAAGGGGASQLGQDASASFAGDGGDGVQSNITGTLTYRGGGGGGGTRRNLNLGAGGLGGGGIGGGAVPDASTGSPAGDGTVNTGGGGGGQGQNNGSRPGGSGGSGVVILRYPAAFSINIGAGLTGTESTDGDFKYAEITSGTGNVSFS